LHKLPRTQQTLAKRVKTLRALLNQSASEYYLLKAAAKLRDAQIQVLKAKIGELPIPTLLTPLEEQRLAKLSRQIELLRATTPSEILTDYRWTPSVTSKEA
jgi:hypothetical protein